MAEFAFLRDFERFRLHRPSESPIKIFLTEQGLWALLQYRIASAVYQSSTPYLLKRLVLVFLSVWQKLIEITTGFCLPYPARIGPGLYLPHLGPVILNNDVVIGEDCDILPGVVIGMAGRGVEKGVPVLKDRVHVSANAVVVGAIVVEHDAMIGASSLVCEDVPAFATVLGVPATIINMKGSVDYIVGARSRAPTRAAASGPSGQVSRFPEPRIRAGE